MDENKAVQETGKAAKEQGAVPVKALPKKGPLLKLLKYLGMSVILMLLILGGAIYYLLFTTSGAKFAAQQAGSALKDMMTLEVNVTGGSLYEGLETERVLVEVPDAVRVEAKTFAVKWDLTKVIFNNLLDTEYLKASGLTVTLLAGGADKESTPGPEEPQDTNAEPFKITFPVDIVIRDFAVSNFAYLSEIVDVRVADFQAFLEAKGPLAAIRGGTALSPVVELKNTASAEEQAAAAAAEEKSRQRILNAHQREESDLNEAIGAGVLQAQMREGLEEKDINAFGDGGGLIKSMPVVNLPLDIEVLGLKLEQARYFMDGFDTGLTDLSLSASWQDSHLTVMNLEGQHEMGQVKIYGTMDFEEHFKLDFNLEGEGALNEYNRTHFEGLLHGLKGEAQVAGDLVDLKLDAKLENPEATTLSVRINCLSSQIPLEVKLDSDYLRWPLFTDEAKAEAYGLHLSSVGSLVSGLDTSFKGTFSGYGFENYQADFKGLVSLEKTVIENLDLQGVFEGAQVALSASGTADYFRRLGYSGALSVRTSDAGFAAPNLKGPLNAAFEEGAFFIVPGMKSLLGNLNVFFKLPELKASLFLNGVSSNLNISDSGGDFRRGFKVGDLNFVQGENIVNLHGVVSENSQLESTLELKKLDLLLPGLEGRLSGDIKADGNLKELNLALSSRLSRLRYGDTRVHELILDARTNTLKQNFEVTAIASRLILSPSLKPMSQCILDFSGDLGHHSLSLNCDGSSRGFLAISGSLREDFGAWQGALEEFFVQSDLSGAVSLVEPIAVSVDLKEGTGEAAAFTLRGDNGALNVEKSTFGPGSLATGVNFRDYDLKSLNDLMPENVRLSGPVSLTSSIKIANGIPDIKADLSSDNTRVFAYGVPLFFEKLQLNADVTGENLKLLTDLQLARDQGSVKLDFNLLDPLGSRRLDGTLELADFNLALLTAVGSQFNDLQGKANIKGRFSGDIKKPLFIGELTAAGSAEPRLDIGQVDSFELRLTSKGQEGDLNGNISLNGTPVQLKGALDWSEGAYGEVDVTASRLPVFLVGFGQALADIRTHASFKDAFYVSGDIKVPEARIRVSNIINSGAQPSGDEILVPEGGTQELIANVSAPVPSVIDLDLSLGDKVQVDAMGLTARLEGGLKVQKALTDTEIKGDGEVRLEDARADLFGHRFIVNHARTLFSGNIADPRLDCEVIADPEDMEDDVVAGVRVTGTASDPRIALFSEPSMSDNEVLSYILYGHGLEKNNSFNQENANSTQMLLGLGLGSTTGLVNALVGAFGVQDVQVGASGSGDETQVSVQGYLTRRIRISYGYGVFNAVGEFKVRYELMRKLYAEFVSSVDQAADLIYSFEFD